MKPPKDKAVKTLKRLVNTYVSLDSTKNKLNKKMKEGTVIKPYEPLFDKEREIKIVNTKLMLLKESIDE